MDITAGHSSAAARTSTREAPSVEEIPVEYSGFLENTLKDRNCRNERPYPFNGCLMNIYNEPGPVLRVKKTILINHYALSLCFPFLCTAHLGKTVPLSIREGTEVGETGVAENLCVLALRCRPECYRSVSPN